METKNIPAYDQIFTCSLRDRNILQNRFLDKVISVLPNVVSIPKNLKTHKVNGIFTILFVGTLGYYPNVDGLLFFADQIVPIVPILREKFRQPWQLTPHKTASTFKEIKGFRPNGPEIILLDKEFSDTDIAWLHKRGNCFVSLARGEGWGMGSYEAVWWGKPVIITGFGSVLDYLPENISYHVNYRLVPVHFKGDKQSYTPDQLWAEPDLAHARQLMRQVFEDQKGAAEKGMQLKNYVSHNFNSVLIARKCLDALEAE